MTTKKRSEAIRYLGLDLAKAPRYSSGGAVMEYDEELEGLRLVSTSSLRAHEDVLGWLSRNRGRHGAIVAVNAPIIVENSSGKRACDVELYSHFAANQVDEYHVNTVNASHPR
ncbi:MAG: DUF429 domain-containing protein, partial [Myxococcota bacterium]|nr:DUF429 domain-containing protein [Myxococcota bacterium]